MNQLDDWQSDQFLLGALAWADAALSREGRDRSGGPTSSRIKPWGMVLALPLSDGDTVWFKAAPHGSAEPILHQTLDAEIPEYVAPVLAADLGRGWLLMDDAGESLGNDAVAQGIQPCGDPRFQRAMTTYAWIQDQVRQRVDELVTHGLPDARPQALPGVFDQLLASMGRRARDTGDQDASDLLARIAAARPMVVDLAASCSGHPASIDHNDLHPWNVLVRDGQTVFLDWGDAMAAHPYASLLVPIRIALTESQETAKAVLDAYARGRDERMDPAELAAVLRLSTIARAWTWQRSIALRTEPHENDGAPLKWLARVLDPDPFQPNRD